MSNVHNENLNKSKINTDSPNTQLESTQSISESSDSPTQPDTSKSKKRKSKPRKKELSLSDIKKKVKQINTLSEYVIDEENKLSYYEIFDGNKIEELLIELQEHVIYDKENNIGFFEHDLKILQYVEYLMVKYFTNLYGKIGKSFEVNRQAYKDLKTLDLIWLYNNHIFKLEETAKVFNRVYATEEMLQKQIELDDETKAKLENLQHKDILFNKLNKNKIIPEA